MPADIATWLAFVVLLSTVVVFVNYCRGTDAVDWRLFLMWYSFVKLALKHIFFLFHSFRRLGDGILCRLDRPRSFSPWGEQRAAILPTQN